MHFGWILQDRPPSEKKQEITKTQVFEPQAAHSGLIKLKLRTNYLQAFRPKSAVRTLMLCQSGGSERSIPIADSSSDFQMTWLLLWEAAQFPRCYCSGIRCRFVFLGFLFSSFFECFWLKRHVCWGSSNKQTTFVWSVFTWRCPSCFYHTDRIGRGSACAGRVNVIFLQKSALLFKGKDILT